MPTTVNGIGTRYVWRSNVQKRTAVCEFCHRGYELTSYDTRLWFVVLYIPVIPLTKKRILDQCPGCSMHRAMPLAEWGRIKRESIQQGMQSLKDQPNDPAAAKKLHGTLMAFDQHEEAEKILRFMEQQFPNDPEVQVYIGSALDFVGKCTQAATYYERALVLNPQMAAAKIAAGLARVQQGRLDEAEPLLSFLRAPGTEGSAGPLCSLALGYQSAGRHQEALDLFGHLIQEVPLLAQDKSFRKAVKASETALGAKETVLPGRELNKKRLIGWSLAAAALVIGVLGSNLYIARHRELRVVSGLEKPVAVDIEGIGAVHLGGPGTKRLSLPEGRYHATVSGAATETVDFTIEAGFFGRFFRSPVFVLDAGDSAMLISEETFYGDPKRARPGAGGYQILFGKSFYSFPDVDYAFQSFPASISIDSKSSKAVRKTRVDVLLVSPGGVFLGLVRDQRTDEALGLAEWRLRRQPEDEGMLEMYVHTAQQVRKGAQAGAFLQPGLARRPVQISWHRLYQELRSQESGRGSLAAEYDAVLQADPENSSLLYLRGRICPRHSLALPFLQRAAAKDPRNAYAQHALGYIRSSQGDWAGSRDFAAKACELAPENDAFLEALFRSRFALQEYDPLETEIRDGLAKEPLNVRLAARLCDVLVAKHQAADAEQFLSSFEKSFLSQIKEDIGNSCRSLRQHLQYASGDFAALAGAPGKDEADRIARVRGLLEQMKVKEASEALAANDLNAQDPYHLIILSTGWREIQDEEKAAALLNSAVTLMEKDSTESSVVAALLKESEPPSIDAVRDLVQDPIYKAITLVSLSQRHPAKAAEYLELARVLNTDLAYPHHWISRMTEKPGN